MLSVKHIGTYSIYLCCMCRCVLNHVPIRSYYACFNIDSLDVPADSDRTEIISYTRQSNKGPSLGASLVTFLKKNLIAFVSLNRSRNRIAMLGSCCRPVEPY
jgi:hypothetical protein